MTNKLMPVLEIPLAFLSFCFYKIMKLAIGFLYTIYMALNRAKAGQWRVISQELIDSTLSLPVLMTKGPRWNTHAIIGTLGPFKVTKSLAINREIASSSAGSWIMVVYNFPYYKTIANLTSFDSSKNPEWQEIELEPGSYTLGLRYYNWGEKIFLPSIKVDGVQIVDKFEVDRNINDFYQNIIQRKNWFYSALHYYIFTILTWRKILPESFVKKEFLPVGAPDTEFLYGKLERDNYLEIQASKQILENYQIYFTIYDRSSLPLFWQQIKTEKYLTKSLENNGYYLIRMRSKKAKIDEENNLEQQIKITEKTTEKI
ncbi:MAG: DUF6208 family protein [Prochloraceae cyanobacterium]